MQINGGPNATALQHMASRAIEAGGQAGLGKQSSAGLSASVATGGINASGNALTGAGNSLPPAHGANKPPDHATGLARAIEVLRENTLKSPGAKGLQQALEMLQKNSESSGVIDTQA